MKLQECELAGIGILKSVKVAICGMKCVDFYKDSIRITCAHFSYNKTKQDEKDFFANNNKNSKCVKNMEVAKSHSFKVKLKFLKPLLFQE